MLLTMTQGAMMYNAIMHHLAACQYTSKYQEMVVSIQEMLDAAHQEAAALKAYLNGYYVNSTLG